MIKALTLFFLTLSFSLFSFPPPIPVNISSSLSFENDVALDFEGNAVAIWRSFSGEESQIQTAMLSKGATSWSTPVVIDNYSGSNPANPKIALSLEGDVVAVWESAVGSNSVVRAAMRPLGEAWSSPVTLSGISAAGSPQRPRVSLNSSGQIVAIWSKNGENIEFSTAAMGGDWIPPVPLYVSQNAHSPQVKIDDMGNCVALWIGEAGLVRAATKAPNGNWSESTQLSSTSVSSFSLSFMGGYGVALWSEWGNTAYSVRASTLNFGHGWDPSVLLSSLDATTPSVDINLMGDAVAIWIQSGIEDRRNNFVCSSYLPRGRSWSPQKVVSLDFFQNASPQIRFGDLNTAYATWCSTRGPSRFVCGGSYDVLGDTWSSLCNFSNMRGQFFNPTLAVDFTGYGVATWLDNSTGFVQGGRLIPIPTVLAVDPVSGESTGRNQVRILGLNFLDVQSVLFGNTPATSFSVVSPTHIVATAPPHDVGVVDVVVTNTAGTSLISSLDQYTYQENLPTITALSPNAGDEDGGESVTITGTHFTNVIAILFGNTSTTQFTVNSETSITVITPPGEEGVVDVRVSSSAGLSPTTAADLYTYYYRPRITNIAPNIGPTTGENWITLTGSHFEEVIAVTFDGLKASEFTIVSPTSIQVKVPSHAQGKVSVSVETEHGNSFSTLDTLYIYTAQFPTIRHVSPNSGPKTGGNTIRITGLNFHNVSKVLFDTTEAISFKVDSPSSLVVVVPPAPPSTKNLASHTTHIRIVTSDGMTYPSKENQYHYHSDFPQIKTLSPKSGGTGGGTVVTLTGTHFEDVVEVRFGDKKATQLKVNSSTSMTVKAPPHSAGAVSVTLITHNGKSEESASAKFTYLDTPLPPQNFVGKIVTNTFINTQEKILETSWIASPSKSVTYYQISKNGLPIAKIAAGAPLQWSTPSTVDDAKYEIAAFDENGLVSIKVPISLKK